MQGEAHPRAKLSESLVRWMRAEATRIIRLGGRPPVVRWSKQFGVARSTISMSLYGGRWGYLPLSPELEQYRGSINTR